MSRAPGEHVHPTRDDPVVAALSEGVGGPLGDRAGRHRWWTPLRVVLALATVVLALGLVQKTTCYQDSWQDGTERYRHMCYSDLPYLYTGRGFAELSWPYDDDAELRDRYEVMEYPVLISYWAWGAAVATQALGGFPDLAQRYATPAGELAGLDQVREESRRFVAVNAVGLAALTLVAVGLLAGVHRRRPWDAALVAASPALALTALVNWDLLPMALVAGALFAWSRGHPGVTGLLVGLGAAAKLYPAFLLGPILVICLRQRRWADLAATSAVAVAAWAVVNAPAVLSGSTEWLHFWTFNAERTADLGSLWLLVDQAADVGFAASTVNLWSWLVFGAWCLGVLVLGLRAPQVPRLAQLALLVTIGFLLVNKVYSPQYVLWLLPLAALARPRWRDHLVWQGSEVFYFAMVWFYLGGFLDPAGGDDAGFYWLAIGVRVLGQLWLAGVVVRDIVVPSRDPVRALPGRPPVAVDLS
ncbi:glycosyltransferase family 87 protein [Nocardioides coralli]|uniref:glycosyltransferase family 87 protein n=1 Tax=Nocardioides coralli TaxID=2872154 RepID=UPI001CA3E3D4|nr:glycosyltransferase 87 family protein [Nocardioides coralli]QZY29136.1 glycosyltransferase 87 family protein [Nocardioides coralli]